MAEKTKVGGFPILPAIIGKGLRVEYVKAEGAVLPAKLYYGDKSIALAEVLVKGNKVEVRV